MLALFFYRISKRQKFVFAHKCNNIRNLRLAFGDCARFIKSNNLHSACFLKRSRSFEKNTRLGCLTVADHNRNRGCKAESTRTAYYKNGNTACKRIAEALTYKKPNAKCNKRNTYYTRHEHTRYLICNLCNRRFCGGCVAHHFNNLRKCCILADSSCTALDIARLINSCARYLIADSLINRNTLTCKCRLVNSRFSLNNYCVNRNTFAGFYNKNIINLNVSHRNNNFLTVFDKSCILRR